MNDKIKAALETAIGVRVSEFPLTNIAARRHVLARMTVLREQMLLFLKAMPDETTVVELRAMLEERE